MLKPILWSSNWLFPVRVHIRSIYSARSFFKFNLWYMSAATFSIIYIFHWSSLLWKVSRHFRLWKSIGKQQNMNIEIAPYVAWIYGRPSIRSLGSFIRIHSFWNVNKKYELNLSHYFKILAIFHSPFRISLLRQNKVSENPPPNSAGCQEHVKPSKINQNCSFFFPLSTVQKRPLIANKNRRKTYFSPKILEEKPGGISLRSRIYQIQLIETCRNITSGWCHMLKISHISAVRTL